MSDTQKLQDAAASGCPPATCSLWRMAFENINGRIERVNSPDFFVWACVNPKTGEVEMEVQQYDDELNKNLVEGWEWRLFRLIEANADVEATRGLKMSTNNTQKIDSPRDCLARLVERLFVERAHMAPHQKERDNGKLIIDCCEYLGGLIMSIDRIEKQLMDGARIMQQDGQWHLFALDGDGLKTRDSLAELIADIPPLNAERTHGGGEV